MLATLTEVLKCEVEGVEGPNVESGHGTGKGQHDKEHEQSCQRVSEGSPKVYLGVSVWLCRLTDVLRRDEQVGDRVCQPKQEVSSSKPSDKNHGTAKGWLNDTVAHADDEQQEEGEGVASGIEDAHDDEQHPCAGICAVPIFLLYSQVSKRN